MGTGWSAAGAKRRARDRFGAKRRGRSPWAQGGARPGRSGGRVTALRAHGVPAAEVLRELAALRGRDLPTHGGRLFAYVYDPALEGLDELATAAYATSAHVNGLDPTAFPSLLAMENDLV